MSASFAACYCTYDDAEWLGYSLASIYPAVNAIYLLVAARPWNGPFTSPDETLSVIQNFPDPDGKIHLLRGEWTSEVEQRNSALVFAAGDNHDYCFIIDSDEIYDTSALVSMMDYARARPEIGCWHCWFVVYWKTPHFRIHPPEQHHPPVFLKLNSGAFVEYRNCIADSHELIPAEVGFCHHMSYARTDEQIQRKIQSFSHSHQIDPEWFEKKWKAWDSDRGVGDLCPYNPGVYQGTSEVPEHALPKVLRTQEREQWIRS